MLKKLKILAFALVTATICGSLLAQELPKIEVIYPKPGQKIASVDSMFVFGNVTPGSTLKVNDTDTKVYSNGAFIAFLPVTSGTFTFKLQAKLKKEETTLEIPIEVPKPYQVPSDDSTVIVKGFVYPSSDLSLMEGDILNTSFRGTPNRFAYFTLSSSDSALPMTEAPPAQQSYWAEAVFGSGVYPDSLLVKGVYTGLLTLERRHIADSADLTYYLCKKKLKRLDQNNKGWKQQLTDCGCVMKKNDANISIVPSTKVVIGELTDSATSVRSVSRAGNLPISYPSGVKFRVTGSYNSFYRAQLAPGQEVWIPDSAVKILPQGTQIPSGEVTLVRTQKVAQGTLVTFSLGNKLPFWVEEDLLDNKFYLTVYGCTSNIDWIRYDNSDSLVSLINWSQPQKGVMRLEIDLQQSLWGYYCFYVGNQFNLKLHGRPNLDHKLENVRIVIDAGHNPDPGSIGPTGYMEKDANLAIATELAKSLRDHKAIVFMTREGDEQIALHDRPKFAYQQNPDIFISVHNNALPDGVNPFANSGTSTFYSHPHSRWLAKSVHEHLVKATGLPDVGLYSRNLAVTRPTGYLAILVECAFMIMPEQEMLLKDQSFQRKIANGITDGVLEYIESESEHAKAGK